MAGKAFTFEQGDGDVRVIMPLPAAIKAKDVVYALTPSTLTLGIKGQARRAACCVHGCMRAPACDAC